MTTVIGGTIAALVAADTAATRCERVDLYLPERGVGGGFQPLVVDDRRLDLGVRLLELSYGDESATSNFPQLAQYRPGPAGHRPFIGWVRRYLHALLDPDLVEVDRPRMFVNGRSAPDIYFTVDLRALSSILSEDQATQIARDARRIIDDVGPAGLLDDSFSQELWKISLEEASVRNHGAMFHRSFIEPVCRKIDPHGSAAVVAALRRKVWMPLFHPQTLWEAVTGRPVKFVPERPFHTVAKGGTGEVVTRLLKRVQSSPNVHTVRVGRVAGVRATKEGIRIDFGDSVPPAICARPIIGLPPEQLFNAAGVAYAPARLPLSISWVSVPEDDLFALPSVTFVVDPDLPAYRVNNNGNDRDGAHLVSLELSHDCRVEDGEYAARRTLEAIGVLRHGGQMKLIHKVQAPAFTAPTAKNLLAFEEAIDRFNRLQLDAEIIGGASAFGADSLNEQVIQGLRAGEMAE